MRFFRARPKKTHEWIVTEVDVPDHRGLHPSACVGKLVLIEKKPDYGDRIELSEAIVVRSLDGVILIKKEYRSFCYGKCAVHASATWEKADSVKIVAILGDAPIEEPKEEPKK